MAGRQSAVPVTTNGTGYSASNDTADVTGSPQDGSSRDVTSGTQVGEPAPGGTGTMINVASPGATTANAAAAAEQTSDTTGTPHTGSAGGSSAAAAAGTAATTTGASLDRLDAPAEVEAEVGRLLGGRREASPAPVATGQEAKRQAVEMSVSVPSSPKRETSQQPPDARDPISSPRATVTLAKAVGAYADARIRVGDQYQATEFPALRDPPPSGAKLKLLPLPPLLFAPPCMFHQL